jgi:ketosteroid isomerase-like protein
MTDSKIATVQGIYEAFGRGDIDYILGQLTDDVDWASCPDSDIAPWHGIRHGKAEVPGFSLRSARCCRSPSSRRCRSRRMTLT